MPSPDRFPHARRQRRVPVRPLLLGAAAGLAFLLAIPFGGGLLGAWQPVPVGQAVSGQEPASHGSPVPAALAPGAGLSAAVPARGGAGSDPGGLAASATSTPTPTPTRAAEAAPTRAAEAAPTPDTEAAPAPAAEADLTAEPAPGHGVPPWPAWVGWTGRRAPALDTLEGYRWPLAHPRLTLPFGPSPWGSRFVNGEPFHDGVDLATFCSDRILAAHSGTVLAAGRHYDEVMGWTGDLQPYYNRLDRKRLWQQLPIVVVIDDGNGYRSIYAHMWKIDVKKGDRVEAGQVIGLEGMTGRASGCHLHYGLFSPWETDTFRIRPDVVARMKVPGEQIARVDPLLVLPPRAGINAPAKPKSSAEPSASPVP